MKRVCLLTNHNQPPCSIPHPFSFRSSYRESFPFSNNISDSCTIITSYPWSYQSPTGETNHGTISKAHSLPNNSSYKESNGGSHSPSNESSESRAIPLSNKSSNQYRTNPYAYSCSFNGSKTCYM